MTRLSSKTTFFYKRVFPVIWFGLLFIFMATSLVGLANSTGVELVPFVVIPLFMMVFGYFIMRRFVFDLVDEVEDLGDVLLVRNGRQEDRIALSDIMNVNYTPLASPPRVSLSLRRPSSVFGTQVSFCAPLRFVPFSSSPLIDALIARVDAARRR